MTIKLNLRTGVILLAALAILIGGIAYAASQISRGVSGSFIVGQVQTAAGTILLYSQITPSSADLTSVNFGTGDIDAFGNFATISTIPFWAANGGGVPFNLTVQATDVEVSRSGSPIATGSGILTLQMGPAGGPLVKYPDHATTIATGGDPVAMEMELEFLQTPDQLGLTAGDQISFTALFAADALVEVAYTTGDVDGDGTPDFIVGANFADPGGVTSAGSAYVYSGADGSLIHQINGTSTGDYLGRSVAMVGDLDGDGFEDFIVGAYNADPGGNSGAGSAYIYSGADARLIRQINGSAAGDSFGYSVGSAGDVDGDGTGDLIVGATGADPGGNLSAGSAYVYSGADGSLIHQVDGQYNGHGIGRAVAGAGDVNGDGFADFILGTYLADPGTTNAGNAYVYSGADGGVLYTKTGGASFRWLGHSVSPAGDVNADGYADFMVGVPLDDPADMTNAGTVRVYSGLNGSLLRQLEGADTGDRFGLAVASAGDANGDGTLDFIVGASAADPGSLSQAGSAYVLSGATGAVIHQVDGAAAGDYLGHAVAGVGDVDQDGKSDFLIGAYGADPGGRTGAGTAYIYSGADESLIHQVDGAATGDNLGSSVGGPANLAAQGEAGPDVEPGK